MEFNAIETEKHGGESFPQPAENQSACLMAWRGIVSNQTRFSFSESEMEPNFV